MNLWLRIACGADVSEKLVKIFKENGQPDETTKTNKQTSLSLSTVSDLNFSNLSLSTSYTFYLNNKRTKMSEAKDPAIKLFGKTIPLQEIAAGSGNDSSGTTSSACGVEDNYNNTDHDPPCPANSSPENRDAEEREVGKGKGTLEGKLTETTQKEGAPPLTSADCAGQDATAGKIENPETRSIDNETAPLKSSRTEDDQSDTSVSEEKTLKKPDKIIPCPRCKSMDTKFCYYNNYNVNQPRYFCKNCQRYWTAGGTMRNVPVGAGRRKNKSSASHYRHITVSEALQSVRSDVPNGIHHPTLKPNGAVLTFGLDSPLCESMASVLSLAEKTTRNCARNGFNKPENLTIPDSYMGSKNGDDKLSGSSITASNSKDEAGQTGMQEPPAMRNCHGFPPQIPCFPGAPWPYPWTSAQWNPSVPPPAFCPSGYPMPFYPAAAYWGCAVPGAWSIPWIPQPCSPKHQFSSSGPNSPLGKHSRDEEVVKPSNSGEEEPSKESTSERCLWIPKTLRIDDPGEAAKSSIWATLGIKNEMGDSIGGRGLFKSFQSKGHEKNHVAKTSPVLQANPAALCRSLNFHENS